MIDFMKITRFYILCFELYFLITLNQGSRIFTTRPLQLIADKKWENRQTFRITRSTNSTTRKMTRASAHSSSTPVPRHLPQSPCVGGGGSVSEMLIIIRAFLPAEFAEFSRLSVPIWGRIRETELILEFKTQCIVEL